MPDRKPNVIVFFTDQQRHDASGLHGNPLGLMPHFDRLAREGTHVANSFTCQPEHKTGGIPVSLLAKVINNDGL